MLPVQSKESIYEATSRIVGQILKTELSKENLETHLSTITSRSDILNKRDAIEALIAIIQDKVHEQINELRLREQIKPEAAPIQHPEVLETSRVYLAVKNALADWEYVKSNPNSSQASLSLYQRLTHMFTGSS